MGLQPTVSALGLRISRAFRAVAPDPFVIAVLLLALTCALGLAVGDFGSAEKSLSLGDKVQRLADSFREMPRPASHTWSLLEFAMQMCLVLVSGHVVASAPPVRRMIAALAALPRSGHSAAAMVGVTACVAGLVNWGFGLIVGALLARDVGRSLARRGIPHHYPLIAAAGYFGLMVWHGGLSGSAPLTMTTAQGARRTLPPEVVERLSAAGFSQGVPLDHTLFTVFNAAVTLGLVLIVPVSLLLLAPRRAGDQEAAPLAAEADVRDDVPAARGGAIPEALERSPILSLLLAAALAAGLWRFGQAGTFWRLGLNEINAAMLTLGLVTHGSPRRFVGAVEGAVGSCAGIIIQFPIYAAIVAVMVNTGLVRLLADLAAAASPEMLPLTSFFAACVTNLFVPSGGGQWAVQGPVMMDAALSSGVDPGRVIMAVAYGDQLTNMLQPFWALPLLAITGVKARDIVGYTALVMIVAGAWTSLALVLL